MFESILVAVDGSDSSLHALRQTFPIARAEKSTVKVIAVVPPYEGDLRLVGVRGHVTDVLRDPYEKALARANEMADSAGLPVKTVLDVGEPHERIADVGEANGVDLINVKSTRCRGLKINTVNNLAVRIHLVQRD